MYIRRIAWLVLAVLACASVVWAGGQSDKTAAAADAELRVAMETFENELDPGAVTSNASAHMLNSIHDTLILREPYGPPLKLKAGLATSWKWVEPTVFELKLREGVKFHDGTVMDADDVAYSLNRIFRLEDSEFNTAKGRFFDNFKEVEVVDPLTVRIHVGRQDPLAELLLSEMQAGIVPKDYVEKVGLEQAKIAPIGAGPYKVVSYAPDKEWVVERFEDYWGGKAPVRRIRFMWVPEIASRVTALVNKEVDFVTSIPTDQQGAFKGQPDVKVMNVIWPMFHVYVLNMNYGPTANLKVRQAMKMSIDRKALVEGLWSGVAKVPTGHTFQELGDMYLGDLKHEQYSPEKAKQLIKESGYNGEEILLTFLASYYTYGSLAAQAIAEMWQKVGLNVKLQSVETFQSKNYPTTMIRPWSNPLYYPDIMGAFDTHWSAAGWPSRYKLWDTSSVEPEWSQLYEKARFSTDAKVRKDAYRKMLEIAEEKLAGWILLYQPGEAFAMRSDIQWKIPNMWRPYFLSFRAGEISFKK